MEACLSQGYEDYRAYVNPMVAARAELAGEPYLLVEVREGRLVDAEGRSYADFLAGWGTQAFGHRPPTVEAALRAFLEGREPTFYPSGPNPHAGRLAARLHGATGYDAAFFASGGAEAVEAALKLARAATGRPRIACLSGAYHGCTYGAVALMERGPYREGFEPHLPRVDALPFGDEAALEAALADPDLGAVVVEPWQVEAGLRALPESYLRRLCAGTGPEGPLLVVDEIQTGLGRTGRRLASEDWPRRPDVVTLGKALGGGLMPLSAMLTRRGIFDRAYGSMARVEAHASTFSGNALACVAGMAALDLLDEDLLRSVRAKGEGFREALARWVAPSPLVVQVRGEGLLWGVELRAPDHPYFSFAYLGLPELDPQPAVGLLAVHRLHRAGYLTQVCGHAWQVLRLQPPLTTAPEELEAFARALGEVLAFLEGLA